MLQAGIAGLAAGAHIRARLLLLLLLLSWPVWRRLVEVASLLSFKVRLILVVELLVLLDVIESVHQIEGYYQDYLE